MAWGQCDHDDDDDTHDKSLPYFDRRDKDFEELQKVILNQELLASSSIIPVLGKVVDCPSFFQ